ncbi:hypothetical protein FACS1894180_6480 [Bacteroidia bacterium]|nr:hypothetical protein FACS1894178_2340 [Bacteroidia bacterium]GHV44755.1 hypothetical protein FACS1894180_6480 [Bacteroidia bacterium]
MKYENIQILLNQINSQVNDLKNADKISALHIDMVKKTIIDLYEEFLIDKREDIENIAKTTVDKEADKPIIPVEEKEEKKEEMIFIPVSTEIVDIPAEQIDVEEKAEEEVEEREDREEMTKPSHSHIMNHFNGLFDDEFGGDLLPYQRQPKQEQPNDINSRYSDTQPPTLLEKIATKNKKPIQSCITIGDKYTLIKDLFSNNITEYTDTILALNEAIAFNDCLQILAPIQEKHQWRNDSFAALTLLNLLKRRFV